MNRFVYVRGGITIALATLAILFFGYHRNRVVASSFSASIQPNSQGIGKQKQLGFCRNDWGEQFFLGSAAAELLFNPARLAGISVPRTFQQGCTLPNFTQAVTSPESVGVDAHYVGVGYINADTHLDIVTTDNDSASLTILLGTGTGDFTVLPDHIPVGVGPVTVEVGDFNEDGKSDLVVTNETSGTLSVLLGNADGTFVNAPGSPITVGTFPRAVAIGNFNGDSHSDLVISNGGSDNIAILLGTGSGTFTNAPGSPFVSGDAPFHTVIGYFNNDANADLAIAMLADGAARIYLGNGNGTFTQAGAPITLDTFTSFLALGDFNNDNKVDLAAVNRIGANMHVLLGDGLGGFSQAPGSPYSTGSAPMVVATSDLNLDGKLDLAVANENNANTFVYLGNGNGTFGAPTTLLKGHLPTHLAIADFNEDNRPDIATSDAGDNTLTVLLNTCGACPPITINPSAISSGTVGSSYSETFTASGASAPYTFSVTGTLPNGLTLNNATLSGIPTQPGSFPITITAMDVNGCTGSRNFTLVINCQTITVNPSSIPAGTVNTAYNQTFTQTDGIGAATFSLTGSLPNGMNFSSGTLSGTPTQTGSFPITVTTTDSNGCTGSRNYTLVINCQTITVNPASISIGHTGLPYIQAFTQTNGVGTITFSLTGTLPSGLIFSGATLSGTPAQTGSFPIIVTATDSNGCAGSRGYTLVVDTCPTITVNPATLSATTVGTSYNQTFTQTGGVGATTLSLNGTLPTGLNFSGGTLSGTPTQPGSFPITVTATDASGCTGIRNYTLIVNCQTITVTPSSVPAGTVGTAYSQNFSQSGGVGTTTFSLSGKLPTGLSFSGSTLSGTPIEVGNYSFSVIATDSFGCTGSRSYTLTINCQAISVTPLTIPSGTVGVGYSQNFTQSGGIGTTNFSVIGTLPNGITLSGSTLSGAPTQAGSFPITLKATDSNGCTGMRDYTLVINCQTITVNPASLAAGTVNTAYSQTFTQTGGVGTVAFSLTGALPTGLTFSGATLSGTPTQSGSFPITVTATDSNNCTGSRSYTLLINCQTISILPATIPAGTANSAYSQTFTHNGGVGTVSFTQNGKLPTGITFTGATLSGTPTQTGSYPISITATDANNCSTTRNYTLVINCQTITIAPETIPMGMAGSAYSQTFSQTGGIGTVMFSQSGKLPAGMTFTGNALSGTPTQTGKFPITITATDSNGCSVTRNYSLTVNCSTITVAPTTISTGTANSPYTQTFTQSGGIGVVNFTVTGALPSGLTLSGATLSGTPTQTGSFPITIIATDSNGCTGNRNYTLIVNCQGFTINPATLPAGTLGTAYNLTLTQTGGVGATSYNLTGTLPNGINFTGATFSGTPTQPGSFPVTVMATDSNGCTSSRNYTLVINCQTITVNPPTIVAGTANTAYSQSFTHSGGIGTTNFSLTGTLPTGITFSGGALSGTPTQTGSFPITVTATDSNGCTGSRNYTLVVNCQPIAVSPTTIAAGTAGIAYSQSFTQTGGIGTVSFNVTGTLPNGLGFAGGTLSGTPTQTGSFPITVTATDANGCTGSSNYTLVVNCPSITVNPATLPNGFVDVSYGPQTLSAIGGIAPYTFTVSAGVLPGGITLTGANLSGMPTASGTFNFTIQAADSNGCLGTRSYTVIVSGGGNGTGLQFYPLPAPVRLLDTRAGQSACFTPGAQISGGTSLTQPAAGACSIPAAALAVTGNITTVQSGGGFLTIYPSDATRPTVANSNFAANEVLNNVFTVGLGATDGAFKIFVTTNTHVVVDITGYYAPPGTGGLFYHTLPTPIRLLETRLGQPGCFTPGTPLTANMETTQQGTTTCSGVTIPSSAVALYGNATTVGPVTNGFLTFFPADAARPNTASGNYQANQVLNSPFIVGLSSTGQFKIYTVAQTNLVVDVHGYFSTEAVDANGQGLLFTPLGAPVRLMDSRTTGASGCFTPGAPLQAGIEQSQLARGTCTIGASAQAIVGNATVVNNPSNGFLTLWPSSASRPLVASSNWVAGKVFNRYFTVSLGGDGNFKMFASTGTDLVVDVSGYFAP